MPKARFRPNAASSGKSRRRIRVSWGDAVKGIQDWYRYLEGTSRDPSSRNLPTSSVRSAVERPSAKVADSEKPRRREVTTVPLNISIVGIVGLGWLSDFKSVRLLIVWPREYTAIVGLILVFALFVCAAWIVSRRGRRELLRQTKGRLRAEEALGESKEALGESEANLIQVEQRTRDIISLSDMAQLLQASHAIEEAYGIVAESMQRLFPHEPGALCMLSASRNFVEAVAVWGEPLPTERVFAPDDCWALRRGETHVVSDVHSGAYCHHVRHHPGSDGYLCVPMMAQNDALGILHLQLTLPTQSQPEGIRQRESQAKQRLAVTVAGQVGLALGNLRLRETLRILSTRDPLTGLFNRRYLEESLDRELQRATRNQHPLGVAMLDLDHFKRLNDTYGHDAGDTVLRAVAGSLQKLTRGYDIACRYGGEEFTLILPGATLDVTLQRAEQLRGAFKYLDVQHQGHSLKAGTLSVGVADFPQHGSTPEMILRAADLALFRAKADGRDRVVVAETIGENQA